MRLKSRRLRSSYGNFHTRAAVSPGPAAAVTADALARWPDKFVWANFPSSVHLEEPEVIFRTARELLEDAGHSGRFWIQISENTPAGVWRKSFPEIMRAIRDFGAP